mmetsp:Transcript_4415/g.8335  ORF Transcript_4415/g.8335 Transcript_4415/m.8335 type:complete len:149 (-) Transcript_4415:66-512(-)
MKQQLGGITMQNPAGPSTNTNNKSNLDHRPEKQQVTKLNNSVHLDVMVADIVRDGGPGSMASSTHTSVHYRSVHTMSVHSVARSSYDSSVGAPSGLYPVSSGRPTAAELTGVTSDDVLHASRLKCRRRKTADMPAHGRTSNRASFEQN